MKHVVCTILFAMLAIHVFSQEVDEKTARIVAEHFFLKNYGTKASVENVLVKQYKGHESLFYCNMDKGGWVAVPANRNLNPVVAHSDEGSVDLNNAPQVFLDWMEQYEFVADVAMQEKWHKEDRHKKWDELLADDFDEQNVLKSYINYTELLSSKWGQSIPNHGGYSVLGYNSWMPEHTSCNDDNGRCPAGCVAVAIGQIMNYWGYSTGTYSDFNWWTMPDSLDYYNSTNYAEEQASVSYLLKRIGDRTSMNYCEDGDCSSGTDPQEYAPYALENFGYKDDMDYKRKVLHTYNQWVNILKAEILAERPVLYRYIGNHSFVCDGYDASNDNFHFNFGWNGRYNYWVDFEDIDDIPDCDLCQDYTSLLKHACIVNIRPNVSSAISLTNKTIFTPSSATWPTNTTYQAKSYISAAGNSTTVTIMDNASCRFVAGDSIILKPGFHAQQGSSLLCKVFKKPTLKEGALTIPDDFSIITYSDEENIENHNNGEEKLFDVYPNPAKNEITISLKNFEEKELTLVQIYNSNGTPMFEQKTIKSTIIVDVSAFPLGQYVINIKNNSKIYCKSFIKQ